MRRRRRRRRSKGSKISGRAAVTAGNDNVRISVDDVDDATDKFCQPKENWRLECLRSPDEVGEGMQRI